MKWILSKLVAALYFIYKVTLSPFLGHNCRFSPTCSEYAKDAVNKYGLLKGSYLAAKRLLRCNPFGGSGYDPVPEDKTNLNNKKNVQ